MRILVSLPLAVISLQFKLHRADFTSARCLITPRIRWQSPSLLRDSFLLFLKHQGRPLCCNRTVWSFSGLIFCMPLTATMCSPVAFFPRFFLTRDRLIMSCNLSYVPLLLLLEVYRYFPCPWNYWSNTDLHMLGTPLTGWPRTPNVIFALSIWVSRTWSLHVRRVQTCHAPGHGRGLLSIHYPALQRREMLCSDVALPHCHLDDGKSGISGWDSVDPWDSAPVGEALSKDFGGPAGVKGGSRGRHQSVVLPLVSEVPPGQYIFAWPPRHESAGSLVVIGGLAVVVGEPQTVGQHSSTERASEVENSHLGCLIGKAIRHLGHAPDNTTASWASVEHF